MPEKGPGDLPRHPVIVALEDRKVRAVPFRGYLGSGGEGVLRLYTSLDLSTYVDIPQEAVVHVQPSDTEEGYVSVVVEATATVTIVRQQRDIVEICG
jgi:hypothetical protein